MNKLNRRKFLTLAGVGSAAAAAGAALPGANLLTGGEKAKTFTFRAVVGLPKKPLPAYASYVIEGHVDLAAGSGVSKPVSSTSQGEDKPPTPGRPQGIAPTQPRIVLPSRPIVGAACPRPGWCWTPASPSS